MAGQLLNSAGDSVLGRRTRAKGPKKLLQPGPGGHMGFNLDALAERRPGIAKLVGGIRDFRRKRKARIAEKTGGPSGY